MLGGPEFQRRLVAVIEAELDSHRYDLILAKDWSDFVERRGKVRGMERVVEIAHEIVKKMEDGS